jgi:hypothetical protein
VDKIDMTIAIVPVQKAFSRIYTPAKSTGYPRIQAKRIGAERARNREIRENPGNDCDDAYFPSLTPPRGEEDPPPF